MSVIQTLEMALEAFEIAAEGGGVNFYEYAKQLRQQIASEKQQPADEPVALKKGECWPEYVMQEWDYWREQIANGNTGSAPRDWFEELAELKLVNVSPQPAAQWVELTDEEIVLVCAECAASAHRHDDISYARAIEAKLKEKNT